MHKMILNPESLEDQMYNKFPNRKCICGEKMYFIKNEIGFLIYKCDCGITEKVMFYEELN